MSRARAGIVTLSGIAACAIVAWAFLKVESQAAVAALSIGVVGTLVVLDRSGLKARFDLAVDQDRGLAVALCFAATLALAFALHDSHFALLMLATVALYSTACLGLTVQFGFAGIANFAGAAFFGVGCYAAAVMVTRTAVPHVLVILASGLAAGAIGSLLILPILRTRGHYAALVTIAFGILFKTFLEVNDTLGGPQGLKVPGMRILGWSLNDALPLPWGIEISFYLNYVLLAVLLAFASYIVVRRIESSWIGLNLDAVRLDETAAAASGMGVAKWKIFAFVFGNVLAGMAGAIYAMMSGFIAPNSFTFGDSLILVSIVILGGLGNPLGVIPAALLLLVLPEKLQAIQEYRFLLYAVLVILILLYRPQGLLPRRLREYALRRAHP